MSEGEVTRGVITAVRPEMGLVLRLADNVRGAAGLTDLSDDYVDYPTAGYEIGHLVRCFILKYNEAEKRAETPKTGFLMTQLFFYRRYSNCE